MEPIANNTNLHFVRELNQYIRKNKFMLAYSGQFSHVMTKSILSLAEKKLDDDKAELNTKKKVVNIMIECMQNICSNGRREENNDALFMLKKEFNGWQIISGNTVKQNEVEPLREHLDLINSQDKGLLKKTYTDTMKGVNVSAIGEAGLSMIDIAKKSGNKLEFAFTPIDNDNSFFSLQSSVKQEN